MKIRNKRNNRILIIAIIAVVVVALATVGIVLGVGMTDEGISLISTPNDVTYFQYEPFDITGLRVQLDKKNDAFSKEIDLSEIKITGFDSSKVAKEQVITVSYKGYTTTFKVEIAPLPEEQASVIRLDIDMDDGYELKTVYEEFEPLDLTHMYLILTYSDGTRERIPVTKDMISGYDNREVTTTPLRVKVTYGNRFTTFNVSIVPKSN